jgi:GrpB-like predicted nucleotidyltransferase (UPF0157 family)
MKLPPEFPDSYFEKKGSRPVKIKPYNPRYKEVAKEYLKKLDRVLKPAGVKAIHKGATALGISGKGDIEFGVYPRKDQFDKTLVALINHFKGIKGLNNGFAQFVVKYKGFEMEVVVINEGDYATLDKKLDAFLKKNPKLVKEYEKVKNESAYSAKEYARAKDKFLRKVIEMITERE